MLQRIIRYLIKCFIVCALYYVIKNEVIIPMNDFSYAVSVPLYLFASWIGIWILHIISHSRAKIANDVLDYERRGGVVEH